ncbi:S1 domain-containing RNA-binding protein [Bacillus horti]|uniref:S1 RNA binding domain protein n=1 Tax=Caldalkalibacillus horti TaxID=77523 RepID=A0ABT9W2W1_9BACI|nr:S1 domain-containing RNA-binding protein [Bacillus horti]MDQ0167593.1 S1 RNA binding domain protein [Bacillus horti]
MSIEVGSKLEGKVTGITHFGAFVELPDGVTGLVHISEIADNYVKDVNEFLKVNDMVTIKVINIEKDGKIGLSIKQAQDRPVESKKPTHQGSERRTEHRGSERRFEARGSDRRGDSRGSDRRGGDSRRKVGFEDIMSKFLKDSEDRLTSLKRNTESKRGGRGARKG